MANSVDEDELLEFKDLSLSCVAAVGGALKVRSLGRAQSGIQSGDAGSAARSLRDYLNWISGIWRKWNTICTGEIVKHLQLTNRKSKKSVSLRGVKYKTAHEASVNLLEPLVNLPAEFGFDSVSQLREHAAKNIRLCHRAFRAIEKAQMVRSKRLESMIEAEWVNAVRAVNGKPSGT